MTRGSLDVNQRSLQDFHRYRGAGLGVGQGVMVIREVVPAGSGDGLGAGGWAGCNRNVAGRPQGCRKIDSQDNPSDRHETRSLGSPRRSGCCAPQGADLRSKARSFPRCEGKQARHPCPPGLDRELPGKTICSTPARDGSSYRNCPSPLPPLTITTPTEQTLLGHSLAVSKSIAAKVSHGYLRSLSAVPPLSVQGTL